MPEETRTYPGFHLLKPEIYGQLGRKAKLSHGSAGMVVEHLHYIFDQMPRDPIFATYPCFGVIDALANALRDLSLSGFSTRAMTATKATQFHLLSRRKRLPKCWEFLATGLAGEDDFGLLNGYELIISNRALEALRTHGLENGRLYDATTLPSQDEIRDELWAEARAFVAKMRKEIAGKPRMPFLGHLFQQ